MKPDLENINEVVKRHLPSASSEEIDVNRAHVLQRLRSNTARANEHALQESFSSFRPSLFVRWRIAVVAAAVAAGIFIGAVAWRQSRTVAIAENLDGGLYRLVEGKTEAILAGERIVLGEIVRSSGGFGSALVLKDGSRIEMRSKSELWLEDAEDGTRIHLRLGSIIVNAAKQGKGHLYVQTKDVTVSVVGTVFLVNAEAEGSRVAVIEGEVHVLQGATAKRLLPGEQISSNPLMDLQPVSREISWSRSAETHLALLQQSIASAPEAPKSLQFEVASIKPALPTIASRFACRGIDGTLEPIPGPGMMLAAFKDVAANGQVREGPLSVPNGRCIGQLALVNLVGIAYDMPARNISGGPDWAQNRPGGQRFQIETKAENVADVTKEQLRQMLQRMLADRFKLTFHWETRESQGLALLVATGPLKLKEASGELELPHLEVGGGGERIIKGKSQLKNLADFLLGFVSVGTTAVPILDKTELTGKYDYTLILHPAGQGGGLRGGGGNIGGGYDPPISTALQEQLGLRLEPQKVRAETIVIDDVEQPSEN
jgi:uncharacterized protein (TIGR03435 family)